ncbi:MAG: RNA ligase family protein [Phycisphaerales bacterium]|nr:RNA ligase family protein [Phycisphaerales bacterium]
MSEVEFKAWGKIPRENPFTVTITEKIDGTNGCVIIQDNEIVGVQSRKRFITPEDDNYGFAGWVGSNKSELLTLGDGYHYGEWAGVGIQKNPLVLDRKHFFLFNTSRWNPDNPNRPGCCDVVPILFQGELLADTIPVLLDNLKRRDPVGEGVMVYYHTFRKYTKHTIISSDGKWHK